MQLHLVSKNVASKKTAIFSLMLILRSWKFSWLLPNHTSTCCSFGPFICIFVWTVSFLLVRSSNFHILFSSLRNLLSF